MNFSHFLDLVGIVVVNKKVGYFSWPLHSGSEEETENPAASVFLGPQVVFFLFLRAPEGGS